MEGFFQHPLKTEFLIQPKLKTYNFQFRELQKQAFCLPFNKMSFARPGGLDFPPFDQERGRDRPDLHRDIFDPRIPTTADDEDFEERYHPEEHVLTSADKALFGVRCVLNSRSSRRTIRPGFRIRTSRRTSTSIRTSRRKRTSRRTRTSIRTSRSRTS